MVSPRAVRTLRFSELGPVRATPQPSQPNGPIWRHQSPTNRQKCRNHEEIVGKTGPKLRKFIANQIIRLLYWLD